MSDRFLMKFVEQLSVYFQGDSRSSFKGFDDTDNQTKELLLRVHFLRPRGQTEKKEKCRGGDLH